MNSKVKKILLVIILIPLIGGGIIFSLVLIDTKGTIPRFVKNDWIELDKIYMIGKFHSTLGHGYPDDDLPYSDKHYFEPSYFWGNSDDKIKVFAPFDGVIITLFWENHRLSDGSIQGHQIWISSVQHPSIRVCLFHINIEPAHLYLFQHVHAGQFLGYVDARDWCSTDIAVYRGTQAISWFEILSDELFEKYQERGISSREQMIKTDEQFQQSIAMGYNIINNSDPADMVLLKNNPMPYLIDHNFINVSKVGAVSYFPNLFIESDEGFGKENVSWTTGFRLDPNKANITGHNTEFYAPFRAEVVSIGSYHGDTPQISLKFLNSTASNYTGADAGVQLDIYNITAAPGLDEGDIVESGELLGHVGNHFILDIFPTEGNSQPFSTFDFMAPGPWEEWANHGLSNRSAMELNFDEFRAKVSEYGNTSYGMTDNPVWWIPLS
ncbi:MAG: hypothetical protein ACTSU2_12140 [Promethearchaeota archaeon]